MTDLENRGLLAVLLENDKNVHILVIYELTDRQAFFFFSSTASKHQNTG